MAGVITAVTKSVEAVVKTVSFGIELYRCPKLSRNLHEMNPLGNMFFYDTRTKKCSNKNIAKNIRDYLSKKIGDKNVGEFLEYFFNIYLKSTGNNKYISGQLFGFDSKKSAIKANTYFKHFFYHYVIYFADSEGNVYFYSVTQKEFINNDVNANYNNLFEETNENGKEGFGYMTLKKDVLMDKSLEDLRKALMTKEYGSADEAKKFKTKNNVRRSLMIMNFEKLCQILHFYFHGSSSMIYYKLSRPELFDFSLLGNHYFFNTHRYFYTKLGPFRTLNKDLRDELKKTFREKYKINKSNPEEPDIVENGPNTSAYPISENRTIGGTGSLDDSLDLGFITRGINENELKDKDDSIDTSDFKDLHEQYGEESLVSDESTDESIKPISQLPTEGPSYGKIIQETPIYHLFDRVEENNIQDTMDARRRLLQDMHTNDMEYLVKEHYLDMYMATTNDEGEQKLIPETNSSSSRVRAAYIGGGGPIRDEYQKIRKEKLDKCFQKKFEIEIEDLEIAFGRNMQGKNIGLFNKEGTKYPQEGYLEILKKIAEFLDYKSTNINTLKIVPFLCDYTKDPKKKPPEKENAENKLNKYIRAVLDENLISTNTYTVSSWNNIDLKAGNALNAIIGAHMAMIGNKCNLGHLSRMRVTIGGIKYSGGGGGKKIITKKKKKNISNHKTKKNKNQIKNIKKMNKNKISRKKNIQKEKQKRNIKTKRRY